MEFTSERMAGLFTFAQITEFRKPGAFADAPWFKSDRVLLAAAHY
jgi:hypothetical protein